MTISDEHLGMLAASGITPEHARLRGYETVNLAAAETDRRLSAHGFTKRQRSRLRNTPGLLIPLLDKRGERWGWQLRNFSIDNGLDTTWRKYDTPLGQSMHLDVPPGVGELLDDPEERLWIVEGTKKADCAFLHGLCAISVLGVYGWRGTNGYNGLTALADWEEVALKHREVVVAFDGDMMRKEEVRKAALRFAKWLEFRGATVYIAWLPDTKDKTGLDDFLAAGHTVEELAKRVKRFDRCSPLWLTEKGTPDNEEAIRRLCLPEEFWERDSLAHFRQVAWHHVLPPDSVLNAALAKLSACIPPTVRVNTGILKPIPIHHFGSITGPSGQGKSSMADVGQDSIEVKIPTSVRDLVPSGLRIPNGTETADNDFGMFPYLQPLGTAAGLCEAYLGQEYYGEPDTKGNRRSRRAQIRSNVLLFSDEGNDFVKACRDPQSGVGETTRAMWSGRFTGQGNASVDTRRRLLAGTYTLAILVGLQEEVLADLLAPQELRKGTPQRFVHTWSEHPDVPEVAPDDPGVLTVRLPVGSITVCEVVAERLRLIQLGKATGRRRITEAAESQRPSVTARIGALLAILDGRSEISESDWALADIMFETSLRIARHCQTKRQAENRSAKARQRMTDLDDSVTETELRGTAEGKVAIRIVNLLGGKPPGWVKWNGHDGLRGRLSGGQREMEDKALDLLVDVHRLIEKKKTDDRSIWLRLVGNE